MRPETRQSLDNSDGRRQSGDHGREEVAQVGRQGAGPQDQVTTKFGEGEKDAC